MAKNLEKKEGSLGLNNGICTEKSQVQTAKVHGKLDVKKGRVTGR